MGTFVGLHDQIYIGQLDVSGHANEINFGDLTRTMQPSSTFKDGGYTCVLPGLISGAGMVKGNQDFAAGAMDAVISVAQLGSQYPITVCPDPDGSVAVGDACWLSRGRIAKENPLDGAVGDVASVQWDFTYDAAITQAVVGHPLASVTADGSGDAIALTGPDASQHLYATLHVTAFSGLTSIAVKIQSDSASGMSSPTDRITFSAASGVTGEWKSVAGDWSSETHVRVTWDVTGTGSATFIVGLGVL